MIYYPYTKLVTDVKTLVRMTKEYSPDTIVAIARGGLTLGHAYASATNNRQLMSVNSILYEKNVRGEKCEIFNIPNLSEAKKVLLMDDIIDSGKTMQEILARIYLSYPNLEVKTASIYYRTDAVVQADFALRETTQWIEFFWEKDFLEDDNNEK